MTAAKSPAPKKTAKPAAPKVAKAAPVAKKADVVDMTAFAGRSFEAAIGRRKTSVARVRIFQGGKGEFVVNGRAAKEFFSPESKLSDATAPLRVAGLAGKVDISVMVEGGGITGQAEAIRLGIARAICGTDLTQRPGLKSAGFLRRDPRQVERKKYGLKKARRAEQFSKR